MSCLVVCCRCWFFASRSRRKELDRPVPRVRQDGAFSSQYNNVALNYLKKKTSFVAVFGFVYLWVLLYILLPLFHLVPLAKAPWCQHMQLIAGPPSKAAQQSSIVRIALDWRVAIMFCANCDWATPGGGVFFNGWQRRCFAKLLLFFSFKFFYLLLLKKSFFFYADAAGCSQ